MPTSFWPDGIRLVLTVNVNGGIITFLSAIGIQRFASSPCPIDHLRQVFVEESPVDIANDYWRKNRSKGIDRLILLCH